MTTADYLEQLQQDREDLVNNLETKGITGLTGDETFTELVPQVLNIPSGSGVDTKLIYNTEPETMSTMSNWAKNNYILGTGFAYGTLTIPSGVTGIGGLFYGWNYASVPKVICTNDVTNMSGAYRYHSTTSTSTAIKHIDVSGLDTSNVLYMNGMFAGLKGLLDLDLSNFVIKENLNTSTMFDNCISLAKIDMRSFDFSKLSSYASMFGSSASDGVPDDCEIIVADATQKTWVTTNFSRLTNVKTVAEYNAS
jgi:hypothetical protein